MALGYVASGWYFASVLERDGLRVDHGNDPSYPFTVTAIDRESDVTVITLTTDANDAERRKDMESYDVWGLDSETAFGTLLEVMDVDGATVSRRVVELTGKFSEGDEVRLIRRALMPFAPARGATVTEEQATVTIDGPLGPMPAWLLTTPLVQASQAPVNDRWAILIHGRTSGRSEALSAWQGLGEAGYHALAVTYRNDEGNAFDESGYYQFGLTEWADIEAAVEFAVDMGAEEIVLVGNSMGGGIALSFMERSELAGEVDALILDAPMVDFGRTVDLGASNRGVPTSIVWLAKRFSTMRFDLDWDDVNYLSRIDDLAVPTLLFHGDDDPTVPVETSREMAEAQRALVTYEEFPGAGHLESWSSDPVRYNAAIVDFLSEE